MFKDTLKWVTIAGVFAVPVFIPFLISESMFFPFITGKNFTFRIIVEIILTAWVLLALLDARYRPRFSFVLSAFALFIAVVGIADISGVNPFKSIWSNFERMEGYIALLHLFAYFVVASTVLNTQKFWSAFWYTSLGASVFIALKGLLPIFEVLPKITYVRIDASFGNPIYLAIYAVFHIFIALVLMVRWKGTYWHQVILGVVALLHLVTLVFTFTRGSVLGFIGGTLLTTILIAFFERDRMGIRKFAIGALLAIVLIIGSGFTFKDTEFAQTNPIAARFTQMSFSEGTINARFMNWGMAWEGVKERPLLGWGQGNYEHVFSKYYDPNMWGQEPWFDRTHNIIFDWLIAAGFLGLIAYLFIPLSLMMHLWVLDPKERHWSVKSLSSFSAIKTLLKERDDTFTATERALWTGLIAAYLFHNLFVFDNITSYILFATVLAYLHWRVTEGHAPMWGDKEVSREVVMSVALPIVLVIGSLTIWYVNVPGIKTSQTLINAIIPQRVVDGQVVRTSPEDMFELFNVALEYDQLGRQEVREQVAQAATNMLRAEGINPNTRVAFRDTALEEIDRELARNPDSARLWLFAGTLYINAGMIEEGEAAFARAVELTPTKQAAIFQLGEVKLALGKTDEALELFKQAYELAPEYDEARKLYALVLVRTGQDKAAVDLLTEKFGTAAIDDSRLFIEWTNAKRFDIAATILEGRVAANPADAQHTVSLAAAYKELGRIDEAIALLENLKKINPEYTEQMDQFIKNLRGW